MIYKIYWTKRKISNQQSDGLFFAGLQILVLWKKTHHPMLRLVFTWIVGKLISMDANNLKACHVSVFSPPARWGSLEFNKGATHPPSSPRLLFSSTSVPACRRNWYRELRTLGGLRLDPNLISQVPDAVGCAWTRTERMPEENVR